MRDNEKFINFSMMDGRREHKVGATRYSWESGVVSRIENKKMIRRDDTYVRLWLGASPTIRRFAKVYRVQLVHARFKFT